MYLRILVLEELSEHFVFVEDVGLHDVDVGFGLLEQLELLVEELPEPRRRFHFELLQLRLQLAHSLGVRCDHVTVEAAYLTQRVPSFLSSSLMCPT